MNRQEETQIEKPVESVTGPEPFPNPSYVTPIYQVRYAGWIACIEPRSEDDALCSQKEREDCEKHMAQLCPVTIYEDAPSYRDVIFRMAFRDHASVWQLAHLLKEIGKGEETETEINRNKQDYELRQEFYPVKVYQKYFGGERCLLEWQNGTERQLFHRFLTLVQEVIMRIYLRPEPTDFSGVTPMRWERSTEMYSFYTLF